MGVVAGYTRVEDGETGESTDATSGAVVFEPSYHYPLTFAQKYDSKAGVGTVAALMLPYVVIVLGVWMVLFAIWQLSGLPWGL